MNDEEIMYLRKLNVTHYQSVKDLLFDNYMIMDKYLMDCYEKGKKHQHFETEEEMKAVMANDWNPFNTFSFGDCNQET